MSLKILKNGILEETYWHFDEAKDEGSYLTKDVTTEAVSRLFDACELDKDVTLRDVCKLIDKANRVIMGAVLKDWVPEYVDAVLKAPTGFVSSLAYIELYWYGWRHEKSDLLDMSFPQCHGIGKPETKRSYYGEFGCGDEDNLDEMIESPAYGISMTSADELADIPIKLNTKTEFGYEFKNKEYTGEIGFSLGHILKGIFWELSFCGGPGSGESQLEMLKERIAEINEQEKK